ncbi:hypothetical protein [Acidiferrobacter sp.]|jgi:hypothetical protein|uniref:hypothetical protein n=1 Tax=Acidiferrobacter sp. TaxID=1872107 RepID=UPI002601E119|nr:hypothetical protein [Acidiferrobacter sp.]
MDLTIGTGDGWFRFQGKEYKIIRAGISKNRAFAETEPHNEDLVDKLFLLHTSFAISLTAV